jgi:DNA-binding transcriptional LysR family regulator
MAGFQSVLSTIVPKAAAALARTHPGIELGVDVDAVEALRMLRANEIDVALIFRYAETPCEDEGFRLVHLLDDPIYLVTYEPEPPSPTTVTPRGSVRVSCTCRLCHPLARPPCLNCAVASITTS